MMIKQKYFHGCIHCTSLDLVSMKRSFPDGLKVGECNLLVVPPGNVTG